MHHDFWFWLSVWVFCGLIAYSGVYAECYEDHGENADHSCVGVRWFMFLTGPIGLVAVAIATKFFKHGLRFR